MCQDGPATCSESISCLRPVCTSWTLRHPWVQSTYGDGWIRAVICLQVSGLAVTFLTFLYQPYNLYICSVHSMFFLQHRRLNNPAKMQLNDHVPQTHSCSCCVPFLTVATGFNWVPVRNINCSISHLSLGLAESEEVRVRRIFIPAQNRIEPTSRPFHLLW